MTLPTILLLALPLENSNFRYRTLGVSYLRTGYRRSVEFDKHQVVIVLAKGAKLQVDGTIDRWVLKLVGDAVKDTPVSDVNGTFTDLHGREFQFGQPPTRRRGVCIFTISSRCSGCASMTASFTGQRRRTTILASRQVPTRWVPGLGVRWRTNAIKQIPLGAYGRLWRYGVGETPLKD